MKFWKSKILVFAKMVKIKCLIWISKKIFLSSFVFVDWSWMIALVNYICIYALWTFPFTKINKTHVLYKRTWFNWEYRAIWFVTTYIQACIEFIRGSSTSFNILTKTLKLKPTVLSFAEFNARKMIQKRQVIVISLTLKQQLSFFLFFHILFSKKNECYI